jgi:hypothetical protein
MVICPNSTPKLKDNNEEKTDFRIPISDNAVAKSIRELIRAKNKEAISKDLLSEA